MRFMFSIHSCFSKIDCSNPLTNRLAKGAAVLLLAGKSSHLLPDLIVYLRADEHSILARLRKRNDVYRSDIDFTYVTRVCTTYDQFSRTHQEAYVTIDTTHIDYVSKPQEVSVLLQQIPLLFSSEPPTSSP